MGFLVGESVGSLVGGAVGIGDGMAVVGLVGAGVSTGAGVGGCNGCSVGMGALVCMQVTLNLHSAWRSRLEHPYA